MPRPNNVAATKIDHDTPDIKKHPQAGTRVTLAMAFESLDHGGRQWALFRRALDHLRRRSGGYVESTAHRGAPVCPDLNRNDTLCIIAAAVGDELCLSFGVCADSVLPDTVWHRLRCHDDTQYCGDGRE